MSTTPTLREAAQALPCPFCGAAGLDFAEGSTFRWIIATCPGCGATSGETRVQTTGEGTPDEWLAKAKIRATEAWNTRAALTQGAGEAVEWQVRGRHHYEWRRASEEIARAMYLVNPEHVRAVMVIEGAVPKAG